MCQWTTNAVTYMFCALGYSCTNYIDDFGSAETPDESTSALNALGDLFSSLGLHSSPDKDWSLPTSIVFLGIHLDTLTMSMSITPDHLQEFLHCCSSALSLTLMLCQELQSLLGVMSFFMDCVCPALVFMPTLLDTLCTCWDSCQASYPMRTIQVSASGATSCHFTTTSLSSRHHPGSLILGTFPLMLATLVWVNGSCFNTQLFHTPFPYHP